MPKDKGYRKNGQTVQPGIQYPPEGNGWPQPLTDQSDPLRYSYVNGKNGSTKTRPVTSVKTDTTVSDQGGNRG